MAVSTNLQQMQIARSKIYAGLISLGVPLEQISDKLGVDKTAALEIAIRRLAELEKIEAPVKHSV